MSTAKCKNIKDLIRPMKALVYTAPRESEIREIAVPIPMPGQALVALAFCGICGSDMHAWHGHDERRVAPLVLGHEAAGMVETGRFAGRRVAINPLMVCKTCPECLRGAEHLCPKRELIGMRVPGAFAEFVAIDEDNLYPIPDHLSFVDAALVEPLACAVHAVRLAVKADDPNTSIVILGGGAIGLLAGLVFRIEGAVDIKIAETNAFRREMLNGLGHLHAIDPMQKPVQTGSADIVLDAVGSAITRAESSRIAKPGGQIVHIGLQDNLAGLDTRRLTLQEINFQGTYCYTKVDFQAALQLLADGDISRQGWSDIRPLDQGAGAFMDVHNGTAPPKIILQTS